jgi:Fe-S cluster biosynthesis and repair protein YggX
MFDSHLLLDQVVIHSPRRCRILLYIDEQRILKKDIDMARMVNCAKLGGERPGLDAPPFPGPLGERIFENVSAEGYALWQPHMTIMINHYGLNPADPETRKMLRKEMEEFFFGADAKMPDGWIPPDAAPTKGGGAPRRK